MAQSLFTLLASDEAGNIIDIPGIEAIGLSGLKEVRPAADDIMPMPFGSSLFTLPGRLPVGWDPVKRKYAVIDVWQGKKLTAVACFMAPAHTQILRAAYAVQKNAPALPLYAYTAVGWRNNGFAVTGFRSDNDPRQDIATFNEKAVCRGTEKLLKAYPRNRLIDHLMNNCVRRYGCPAARNFTLGRFEAPLPTSRACNARCVGCISSQKGRKVPCAQERIAFTPTPGEIAEFSIPHLKSAKQAIVSFGQGCEGEPLLEAETLEAAIRLMRKATVRGTINLNTNASLPGAIERLFEAGLDSIRVSMNSAQEPLYNAYFRPQNYGFGDVKESIRIAKKRKKWCSINYFIFPGFTDSPQEYRALVSLLKETRPDYLQLRNLNMDPADYIEALGKKAFSGNAMGIRNWKKEVKKECPWIRFGYFNPHLGVSRD